VDPCAIDYKCPAQFQRRSSRSLFMFKSLLQRGSELGARPRQEFAVLAVSLRARSALGLSTKNNSSNDKYFGRKSNEDATDVAFASLAVAAVMTTSPAHAQNWPTKPVTGDRAICGRRKTQMLRAHFHRPPVAASGASSLCREQERRGRQYRYLGDGESGSRTVTRWCRHRRYDVHPAEHYKDKLGYDGRKDIRPVAMVARSLIC